MKYRVDAPTCVNACPMNQPDISILAVRDALVIHADPPGTAEIFSLAHSSPPKPSARPPRRGSRWNTPLQAVFLRQLSTLCSFFARRARCYAPTVSPPAWAAPRFAGASLRTGVGSGGSPPGAASSTVRVSPSCRYQKLHRRLCGIRLARVTLLVDALTSFGAITSRQTHGVEPVPAHDCRCDADHGGDVSAGCTRRSGSPSFVRVVEPTYLCTLDHATACWWLDGRGSGASLSSER
jgi:hypothetical protein